MVCQYWYRIIHNWLVASVFKTIMYQCLMSVVSMSISSCCVRFNVLYAQFIFEKELNNKFKIKYNDKKDQYGSII